MTGERRRLPNRRLTITHTVVWDGRTMMVGVGFDRAGVAREIFLNGHKVGSKFEALMQDACVVVSWLLQHGPRAADLAEQIDRPHDDTDKDGNPAPAASLIGWILIKLAEIEAAEGQAAREAYAALDERMARDAHDRQAQP